MPELPPTLTKQKLKTRTIVTIALVVLGLLGSAAAGIYFTRHYQPPGYANQANNQYANNQFPPPINQTQGVYLRIEGAKSQYQVGEEVKLK